MILERLPTGPLEVNCYLLGCTDTRQAAVIDPGGDGTRILERLQALELTAAMVINTHGHFDHIGGNRQLIESCRVPLLIHRADVPLLATAAEHAALFGLTTELSPTPDRELEHDDRINVGQLALEVIHTPGHSAGGICLYREGHLWVGDTLFAGSVGRTDLPGGDHQLLLQMIRERLLGLPDNTQVYPGHGPVTTIGAEKMHNPFLQ